MPSSAPSPLPVGVMMPVLNARAELPRHLERIGPWLDLVSEVVVVDSRSEDGTLDYLKEHLRHPGAKFIDHPPGLYPSWNRGIAELGSEYFFVSTLGDGMTADGVARMHATATALGTDVLVGVPTLVDGDGRPLGKRWPLHEMVADAGIREGTLIDGWTWLAWALLYLPATLIGSSASNLYRTEFMQQRPFSSDYGRIGDSAWALGHSFEARFGIEPRAESTFWVHAAPAGIQAQYAEVIGGFVRLAGEVVEGQEKAGNTPPAAIAGVCRAFRQQQDDLVRYFEAGADYRALKQSGALAGKLKSLRIKLERSAIRRRRLRMRERARAAMKAGSRGECLDSG